MTPTIEDDVRASRFFSPARVRIGVLAPYKSSKPKHQKTVVKQWYFVISCTHDV